MWKKKKASAASKQTKGKSGLKFPDQTLIPMLRQSSDSTLSPSLIGKVHNSNGLDTSHTQ